MSQSLGEVNRHIPSAGQPSPARGTSCLPARPSFLGHLAAALAPPPRRGPPAALPTSHRSSRQTPALDPEWGLLGGGDGARGGGGGGSQELGAGGAGGARVSGGGSREQLSGACSGERSQGWGGSGPGAASPSPLPPPPARRAPGPLPSLPPPGPRCPRCSHAQHRPPGPCAPLRPAPPTPHSPARPGLPQVTALRAHPPPLTRSPLPGYPQRRTGEAGAPGTSCGPRPLPASHTPWPHEGMAPLPTPVFFWAQFLEREVKGSSPRAQGSSRFPQAWCPVQQQEFEWGKGTGLTCPIRPPRPTLYTPTTKQNLLLWGTL